MAFQVEFVKFDEYSTKPKAISCLATQFETAEQAKTEAERISTQFEAAREAEGFRIIKVGALIVAEERLLAPA